MTEQSVTPDVARNAARAPAAVFFRSEWLWKLASFVFVFGLWEIAGQVPISRAFPPFSKVVTAFWRLLVSGEMAAAYAETAPPLITGIVASAIVGVALGIGMGLARTAEWAFYPPLVIMQTAPVAAIIPLITYMYGIGDVSKIMAIAILSVPLVALNSFTGIRNADANLIQMCRSFKGTRRQVVTKILIRDASGMIFAGLRLGVSGGFIGIVLAELLITPTGVGDLISYYRSVALYAEMYASIISIIALATIVLAILQAWEHRLFGRVVRG